METDMRTFEWIDATSVPQAARWLSESTPQAPVVAKAGGMDLLDLMKEGIVRPARVINLQTVPALRGLRCDAQGLRLGALTTLAQIAQHAQIQSRYAALAAAAAHAATPQIRNAATLGGNLLQRPRCWYFRNRELHASPAALITAPEGMHQYHAIFDTHLSSLVQASTLATALVAYGAQVHLTAPNGQARELPLQDFLVVPDATHGCDASLQRGEVLTHISVPAPASLLRAAYHKQTERDSFDWPLCDVAVVLRGVEVIESASIVLGWVAPVPRRATASETLLLGQRLDAELAATAAHLAISEAKPLARNQYKVTVLEAVVRRTLLAAAAATPSS
jgi:xanthine dehydrogenase YagS FAD-binding subunit